MAAGRNTYAALAGGTALVALVVDQLLWTELPLYFGPFVLVAFLVPASVGGVGIAIGWRAARRHGRRFGYALIVLNLLAVVIGIWWAMSLQPRAFGGLESSPALVGARGLLVLL